MELVLDPVTDRVRLDRLRGAVRADFGRSAMIYATGDLAEWIRRSMAQRGWRIEVEDAAEGLRIVDGDPQAWGAIRRALETARFD